jgi:hypothetical protein
MSARKAPQEETKSVKLAKLWSELMELRRKVQEAEASQQSQRKPVPRCEGK